ncbi:PTS system mannose/fructose/N-acetylgalactosamine-transporter subunit IIB [Enterococcus casseliflavus]|uniref:PTS system mannose/fructose/N-acetylgalactosamine-transporter subunit IIB n=1 Tax=Enterococcus casseliflavus TaxID=37734 RepID=UPI0035D8EF0B
MIESIRVDDRLIHGQVALVWSKEFNTKRIVVANDDAAKNNVQQMTLKMATPDGIKLLIKTVDDCIKVFNNPKSKEVNLFVLTSNIQDALKIVKNCSIVKDVNVANVGRFDESLDKIPLNDAIILNQKELEALKELTQKNIPVYHQVVPNNKKTPISKLLK